MARDNDINKLTNAIQSATEAMDALVKSYQVANDKMEKTTQDRIQREDRAKEKSRKDQEMKEKQHLQNIHSFSDALERQKEQREKARMARKAAQDKALSEEVRKQYEEEAKVAEKNARSLAQKKAALRKKELNDDISSIHDKYTKEISESKKLGLAKVNEAAKLRKAEAEELRKKAKELEQIAREASKSGDTTSAEEYMAKSREVSARATGADEIAKRMEAMMQSVSNTIKNTINSTIGDFDRVAANIDDTLSNYVGRINARLQGTSKTFEGISTFVSSNLGVNPYVSTQKVIDGMKDAIDKGILFNIEQRAFLNEISDKIISTFDAFDSNLMRMIKLQQEDSTVARLGFESSLNKFFNQMYSDSEYLNNLFDTVSSTIIDASATLTNQASTEFEYVVQKWLGSLSSVGISNQAVTSLASGLNMLGSGNIAELSSNQGLMTVLAMGASRGGVSLGELMTGEMTASKTNQLMQGLVSYLRDVSTSSSNKAVRAAYGNVFGLSPSDLRAIANLSSSDIAQITSTSMNYSGMLGEVATSLSTIGQRVPVVSQLQNIYQNALYGVANDVMMSPLLNIAKKGFDLVKGMGANVPIPTLSAFGTSISFEGASVQDLLNSVEFLGVALGMGTKIFGSLGQGAGLDLSKWDAQERITRGVFDVTTGQAIGSTSGSMYFGSTSSEDQRAQALAQQKEQAEKDKEFTGIDQEEQIMKVMLMDFGEDLKENINKFQGLVESMANALTNGGSPINVNISSVEPSVAFQSGITQ